MKLFCSLGSMTFAIFHRRQTENELDEECAGTSNSTRRISSGWV